MLAQSNEARIDLEWILLDLQSTISVFRNPTMLKKYDAASTHCGPSPTAATKIPI